jgi:hypothetical protein
MPGNAVAGFYTLAPCRVADTRGPVAANGGPALAAGGSRSFILSGQCGIPPEATAVSLNLTVTQPAALGHITVFPLGTPLPPVSTLNYRAGQTRANNAIVTLGTDGAIDVICAQVAGTAHFIIDVNGYFRSKQ